MAINKKSIVLLITLLLLVICNNAVEEDANLDGASFSKPRQRTLRNWFDVVLGKRDSSMNTDACSPTPYNCSFLYSRSDS
ncbi:unnamed protein product, partial [Rotaria sp. Silwood1]